MPELTDEERAIIWHALGLDVGPVAFRNWYTAAAGDPRLESMMQRGLVERSSSTDGGRVVWYGITAAGAAVAGTTLPAAPTGARP